MDEVFKALVGVMHASFDDMMMCNSQPYGPRSRWTGTRDWSMAALFELVERRHLKRLIQKSSFARGLAAFGYSPEIHEVRVSIDAAGKRTFHGKMRIWPVSPLEQLARAAE